MPNQFEHSQLPPDFEDSSTPRRRAADNPEFAHIPPDLWRLLTDIRDRGIRMENNLSGINGAFVKDEDGKPDFYGHREDHKLRMKAALKSEQTLNDIKGELTKKLVGGLVILVLSLLGSGMLHQLKDLLQ